MRTTAKLGDLLPDNPDRDNPGLVRAENVLPHKTSYQPVQGLVPDTEPLQETCRGAAAAVDDGGVVYNYAGDINDLYTRAGTVWSIVSSAPGAYSLPPEHNWDFTRFYNFPDDTLHMIAANGVDPIQEQVGFGGLFRDIPIDSTDPANITPTPPMRFVAPIRNFLVGGWTATQTSLVKWSAQGNHRIWQPTIQQSGEQVLQRGGQITGVVGGEYGVIFCENSIWRMNYIGAPEVFQFDEVSPGHGTTAPGSIAQYGDNVFYIDTDGFYVFNGARAEPIGSNKVNDTFLKDYDAEFAQRVVSAIDVGRSLVWWAYPSSSSRYDNDGQKIPNKILVFDWTTGRFAGPIGLDVEELIYSRTAASYLLDDVTTDNFPNDATIPGPCFEGGADANCIDLDQFDYDVDSPVFKGGNLQMQAFNFDHQQCSFSGAKLKALIETNETMFNPGGRAFLTGVRPQVDGPAPNISVCVGCRQDTYGNIEWSAPAEPHERTGLANFRKDAYYHRIKLEVDGDFDHIFGNDVEFEQAGDQ